MKVRNLCKRTALLVLLFNLFSISFMAQSKLSAKDVETIKGIEETYRAAWLKNDDKAILSLFTDDATLYPNGNASIKGKDAMYKFWFAPSDTVTTINTYETKIEDINGEGGFAYVAGTNELTWTTEKKDKSESKRFISKGYFLTVYVKHNKQWKILKQFWSGKTQEAK
ncbi:MAG: nuclear transport factor 2 family protein [Acidobacteriota bacterium]